MTHIYYGGDRRCHAQTLADGYNTTRRARALEAAAIGAAVPLDDWAASKLSISIDGWGPPFRLPKQLLLGGAVVYRALSTRAKRHDKDKDAQLAYMNEMTEADIAAEDEAGGVQLQVRRMRWQRQLLLAFWLALVLVLVSTRVLI